MEWLQEKSCFIIPRVFAHVYVYTLSFIVVTCLIIRAKFTSLKTTTKSSRTLASEESESESQDFSDGRDLGEMHAMS